MYVLLTYGAKYYLLAPLILHPIFSMETRELISIGAALVSSQIREGSLLYSLL